MECLSENEIAHFMDGDLAAERKLAFDQHLHVCEACQALMAMLVQSTAPGGPRPSETFALHDAGPKVYLRGERVGRYVVTAQLGSGAMGVVYAAVDPKLDRKVAVKVLRYPDSRGPARMLREAQALAKLSHPNVIGVFDVGTVDDSVFMAMEFVDGEPLNVWLKSKPRTLQQIVSVFEQAGRGLGTAHAAGLVHRDFKPANVMVGTDMRVRVVDFGLARPDDSGVSETAALALVPVAPGAPVDVLDPTATRSMTETGTMLGTPAYMPPEQKAGQRADARSDQYAFCVAFHEALFGVRPKENFDHLAARKLARLRVPDALARIVDRGLSQDPAGRYESMDDLLAAVAEATHARRVSPLVYGGALAILAAVPLALIARGNRADTTAPALSQSAALPPGESAVSIPAFAVTPQRATGAPSASAQEPAALKPAAAMGTAKVAQPPKVKRDGAALFNDPGFLPDPKGARKP